MEHLDKRDGEDRVMRICDDSEVLEAQELEESRHVNIKKQKPNSQPMRVGQHNCNYSYTICMTFFEGVKLVGTDIGH